MSSDAKDMLALCAGLGGVAAIVGTLVLISRVHETNAQRDVHIACINAHGNWVESKGSDGHCEVKP